LQNRFTKEQFITADSITVLQTVSVKKRFAKLFYSKTALQAVSCRNYVAKRWVSPTLHRFLPHWGAAIPINPNKSRRRFL